jgi:S1-C subfamily serine protease
MIRRLVIGMLAVVLLANAALLAGIVITGEPASRPLDGDRILTASRPAILLVQSNYTVSASMPQPIIPDSKVQVLVDQVINQVRAGQVAPNEAAAKQAAINLIVANPDAYFEPGAAKPYDYQLVSSGSGFFVTEDGYFVTAAHVVSADKREIRTEVLTLSKKPATLDLARKQISNELSSSTSLSLSAAQLDSLMNFFLRWLDKYLKVDKVDVRYFLGTGTVEAGERLITTGARASVVNIDPTSNGHDLAVMKADVTGVPTLTLASATPPRMGKATYAIGYPRQGYLEEEAPLNATVKLAMTSGKVVSVDSRAGDWSAYGTDALFTHGDSGGPVLDSDGRVIGVISYSKLDAQGKQVDGGGFFVPSQFVKENLAGSSVTASSGPKTVTSIYYHALAEADNQRYRTELVLLGQVQSRSTWHAYVKEDINNAQSLVLAGKDKTPPEIADYAPAGATSAAAAILIAIVAWVAIAMLRWRRRPALSGAGTEPTPQPLEELTPEPPANEGVQAASN